MANDPAKTPIAPSLHFSEVTFSDGTKLELGDDDIVVFVGPNNAGKSVALREMFDRVSQTRSRIVVADSKFCKVGDEAALRAFLDANALKSGYDDDLHYGGLNYTIHQSHLGFFNGESDFRSVAPFFASRLGTENRIQAAGPANAIALYREAPTHLTHLLLMDDALQSKVSRLFRQAFQMDLIPFRAGGGSFPLYVGQTPALAAGEDQLSRAYVERLLSTCLRLDEQGDGMRSFAAVLLYVLIGDTHSVQFLDEPEAFLHPPQARLIGETIAKERRLKAQLFIATHSTDVLEGLLSAETSKVRVVRIQRSGSVNRVRELPKEKAAAIATDTLTRYSGVFGGIFYKHVVICEADADCLFYSSVFHTKAVSGAERADVLFIHAAGKHRMRKLADTLRALDVPVSVIADIDILSEPANFEQLIESLGGNAENLRGHVEAIAKSVQERRPPLNAQQVSEMLRTEIEGVGGTAEFPKEKERNIKRIFKTLSPWDELKRSGRSALSQGGAVTHFDKLVEKSCEVGLWIVPVGELEGFCRSIEAAHGPAFVAQVLDQRDLEGDPELSEARAFVSKIWKRVQAA